MPRNPYEVVESLARHRSVLVGFTLTQVALHVVMALLHMLDRVVPIVDPDPGMPLREWIVLAGSTYWVGMHVVAAAAIGAGLALHAARNRQAWAVLTLACAASCALWAIWTTLLLIWSLHTTPPVSLTAVGLAYGGALPIAALCSWAWAEPAPRGER